METRRLGHTSLELTVVGFGAWAVGGGDWKFGWGPQDDAESITAIDEALALGVNWIDTARIYGLGRSERVVSEALARTGASPHLLTKCTRVWNDEGEITGSMRSDSIRRELAASAEALGGRPIDMYLIHQPKPDAEIEEGWTTLNELKREGLVRYVGVSNFDASQLRRARAIAPLDLIEQRYSLLDRSIETEILPFCEEHGIGVLGYSPMGSGLLTGRMSASRIAGLPEDDWRRSHPDFQEPALSRNLAVATRLAELGGQYGRSAGTMACAWALGDLRLTAAVVGFRQASQVRGILGDDGFALTSADFARVRAAVARWPD